MRKTLLGIATCNALLCAESTLLDSVVITATRTEHTLLDVPVRTEVIDAQTLKNRHVQDAADALSLLGGVYIRPSHGKEGREVWMQGFNADRVLVLIDGRLPIASTGATVDLSQISIAEIERIEVVKGSTSALYGTSAMGGVINIITRKNRASLHVRLDANAGSWLDRAVKEPSYRRVMGLIEVRSGGFWARASLDQRYDAGFAEDPDAYAQEAQQTLRNNLKLSGGYDQDGQSLFVEAERFVESKERPTLTLVPGIGALKQLWSEEVSSDGITLGGANALEALRLSYRLYAQRYRATSDTDTLLTPFREDRRKAKIDEEGAELQSDLPLYDAHLLTFGVLYRAQSLSQEKIRGSAMGYMYSDEVTGKAKRDNIELYAQESWTPIEGLELLPGVRYQGDSDFGAHVSPKINAMVAFESADMRLNLRGGVGSGYRIPTLKERYYAFDQSQHSYMVIGNPNLQPETSISYQLAAEVIASSGDTFSLSLYRNDIKELIDTALDDALTLQNGLSTYNYQNIGAATTQGFELSGTLVLPQSTLKSAYTYLDAKDDQSGKYLTERPQHQIKSSLEWHLNDFTLVALAQWQSDEYADSDNRRRSEGYALFDAKFTYALMEHATLYGGIDNLFDLRRDEEDPYDLRPKEGRFVYAGLNINFTSKD